jgi:hypothetical protein
VGDLRPDGDRGRVGFQQLGPDEPRHVEVARVSGALAPLSIALNGRGSVATHCGDFETATLLAAEKDVVNEVTGIRLNLQLAPDLPGRILRCPVRGPAQRGRRRRRGGPGLPAPRRPDDEFTPGDLLLDAFVALTGDYAMAVPLGRDALTRLRRDPASARQNLRWLWQGCVLALELWDDQSAYVLSGHHLQLARQTGALSELPLASGSRTSILVFCGELTAAAALVEESRSIHEAGIAEAPYGALVLTAWRGQAREGRELIDVT